MRERLPFMTKNNYLKAFAAVVLLLALVRLCFPSVARTAADEASAAADSVAVADTTATPVAAIAETKADTLPTAPTEATAHADEAPQTADAAAVAASPFFNADGSEAYHRILSVPRYTDAFPDSQSVQYESAQRWGVASVANRDEAESRKRELVYVGSSPFYFVDKMNRSIPYLVPRAAVLLNDIGRAYFDSLQLKRVPLHKFIVTSVLRTKEDVQKLRNYNGNATENSCHLYGTTFDICYNRYKTVQPPDGEERRAVRNDTLKWVLSEVLRDMRESGRCYVKYEVKQGCFHITVR